MQIAMEGHGVRILADGQRSAKDDWSRVPIPVLKSVVQDEAAGGRALGALAGLEGGGIGLLVGGGL